MIRYWRRWRHRRCDVVHMSDWRSCGYMCRDHGVIWDH